MEFEGHQFHDQDTLLAAMRAAWPGVWVQPQGDQQDPLPLSWTQRLGEQRPDWQASISTCLTALLTDGDGLAYAALMMLRAVSWNPTPAIADRLVSEGAALARITSPADRACSLLGELVDVLRARPLVVPLPDELPQLLASIQTKADGYPGSLLLAANLAPGRYLGRIPTVLEGVEGAELTARVKMLLGRPAPVCDEGFSHIAASSPELARRVAVVVAEPGVKSSTYMSPLSPWSTKSCNSWF